MKKALALCLVTGLVAGCSETSIVPRDGDLPRPRGMSPSVAEEADARRSGQKLNSRQARDRVNLLTANDGAREFNVVSGQTRRDWPVDTITYKRFTNTTERAIYLRRALGRYALIEAKERGLGTSLARVRKVARTAAPSTKGEWWASGVHRGDLAEGRARQISLPNTINSTIKNSHQIAAFGDLPAIRGTAIQEARGRFVPEFFAEASSSRENIRATSPAISAGSNREITDEREVEFGVRSRLLTGGEISVSQRFTTTDTNRTSYIPGEQSNSRTTIALVQPLLRGSGVGANDAPRRIANMDTQIATEEFRRQSEAHLMEVERAYWNLYVARAVYVQKNHLAGHGARLAGQVRNRVEIDADPLLVNRAASLAEQWRADTIRAQAAMDNAEFRLAALVNDRRLGPAGVELVPSSAPNGALSILKTNDTIDEIFVNRPELQQAILQYEAALLREGVAANESLPELDLVLEANQESGADGSSFSDAFSSRNRGSGNLVGLKFSVPLGFDERDARYKRRRLETVQQERQVLSVVSTIILEVDVSANEYIVACNDLIAQRKALNAAQRDLNTVRQRWNEGVGGDNGIALMSALLGSYQQVQAAEQAVATARATREISAANLARARGVLLKRWGLKTDIRRDIRNEPTYKIVKR
ncbi:TolC family protein [Actibacterium sp. 188UL27-1]|uniref:TolC family protein n=1 Tax=Actibacterium sp. 188UL27-1 TaxID=2786961 RepID=UPI00195606C8|nr:TolC family protein [Actibacterium sp. 188UL27-1]MBM7069428.1 TolC family protein [Actibacterium sp. 188UL27-1]